MGSNTTAIEYLYGKNIINGYADGSLGGDDPISYAQFAVITYRVLSSVGGGEGSSIQSLKPGTKEYFSWMYLAARSADSFNANATTGYIDNDTWAGWISKLMRGDEENGPNSGIPAGAKPSGEFSPTCPDTNTPKLDAAVQMVDAYIQAGGSKTIFSDVEQGNWYYDGIMYLFDRGITTGYGNGVFGVKDSLTRTIFAFILCRANTYSFTATDYSQMLAEARTYATTNGYMTIPDSTNADDWWSNNITREEAVVGFMKAFANQSDVANANTDILNRFTDAGNLSTDEAQCIAYAVSIGILNGTDQGALNLSGTVDRGTAGILLYRTLIGVDTTKMKDYEENVSYAKGETASASMFSLFSIAPLAEPGNNNTLTLREDWRLTSDLDLAVPEGETLTIVGNGNHIYEMGDGTSGRLLNSGAGTVTFADGTILYPAANDADAAKVTPDGTWDTEESNQLMLVRQPHTPAPTLTIIADPTSLYGGGTVTLTTSAEVTSVTCPGITVTGSGATWTAALPNATAQYTFTAAAGDQAASCTVSVTQYVPPVVPTVPGTGSTTTTTQTNPDGSTTTTTTNTITGTVTETTRNTDGSTTTVETTRNGTVTTTDRAADGSTVKTVENPDGSSQTAVQMADGTTAAATDQNGRTEAEVRISASAANSAANSGEVITLPIPAVTTAANSVTAPVVSIDLPGGTAARVEIPVANVTPGAVAVAVNPDGSETVVKKSAVTEDGVALTIGGDATVKIVDNSKYFVDVHPVGHWAQDPIDFVTSRELFNGTSTTEAIFSPEDHMTRAMLMTVLARFEGEDTNGGSTWYEPGMNWAMANGISDGSNPERYISRQDLATMLYRYAGSPAATGSIDRFPDAGRVSGYAVDAMRWAVGTGLFQGDDAGLLNPTGNAKRAEVAAILMRFCANLV